MAKWNNYQKILLVFFIALVFIYSFNQLRESDAFYHIKTGEVIWRTGHVPHSDVFSFTESGKEWITHEWLSELIFYGVWSAAGIWGLIFFVSLISSLAYYFVIKTSLKIGADFYISLSSIFLLNIAIFNIWIPRPYIFSYLCFAILIFLLAKYESSLKNLYLLLSVIDILFWANFNAGFILGIAVLFIYFLCEAAKKYFPNIFCGRNKYYNRDALKNIGIGILGAFLVSFINPNGYKIFFYIFKINTAVKAFEVFEWKPIFDFLFRSDIAFIVIELIVSGGFLIWWYISRRRSRNALYDALSLCFLIMPFISIRHIVFWSLGSAPFISLAVSDMLKEFGVFIKQSKKPFLISLFIIIVLVSLRIYKIPKSSVNTMLLPVRAADFIEESGISGNMFNLYNEGGYLIWRLWPAHKVFIDGRSEVYGDKEFINDFLDIVKNGRDWDFLVDKKYKVNYFILAYRPEVLFKSIKPLILKLKGGGWKLVYWDENYVIFAKNSFQNAGVINRYAFNYISPFVDPVNIPGKDGKKAALEIERALDQNPKSNFIKKYAKRFLISH